MKFKVMKKILLLVLCVFQTIIVGQTMEGPINAPGAEIIRQEERRIGSNNPTDSIRYPQNIVKQAIPQELRGKLEVTKSDKKRYLQNEKFNLLKLWNNQCENQGKVIDVEKDKDCFAQSGYETGSFYSFENKDYVLQNNSILWGNRFYPNAGVGLTKERFKAANIQSSNLILTQILLDLGETPLANIGEDNLAVKKISAVQFFDKNGKSVWQTNKDSALPYSDDLPAIINHTYLLRSVFVDNRSALYMHLKETIYAFQLVGFENNIALIKWKKISSKRV
jgi:hypothetical protein